MRGATPPAAATRGAIRICILGRRRSPTRALAHARARPRRSWYYLGRWFAHERMHKEACKAYVLALAANASHVNTLKDYGASWARGRGRGDDGVGAGHLLAKSSTPGIRDQAKALEKFREAVAAEPTHHRAGA